MTRWSGVGCSLAFACLALQVSLLTPLYLLSNQPEAYDTDLLVVLARGASVSAVVAIVAGAAGYTLPATFARYLLRGALLFGWRSQPTRRRPTAHRYTAC